ncbi:MAG: hypothetical protein ABIR11_09870 [Candidatus Limnocylindrales bacterium]
MLVDEGRIVGVLLLETGTDLRVGKLELATAAGLLTLHPEGAALHGNIVRPAGIEHIERPWAEDHLLLVVGTPATAAAAARRLTTRGGVGEGHTFVGVSVDVELAVTPATFRVVRPAEERWRFVQADRGFETAVTLDADGIPRLLDAASWPLERHEHA